MTMTDIQPRPTTTDAGIPVESDEHLLIIGADGPILLQDHYLIEQMAQFNRERVPERQPHAKGGGAIGRFEVTHDVSAPHQGRGLSAGHHDRDAAPALHGGR
jgi:catalase